MGSWVAWSQPTLGAALGKASTADLGCQEATKARLSDE